MGTLPAIAQDARLNGGPRHYRRTDFTKSTYGRFFEDNSMEAKSRQEALDAKGRERLRRRQAAMEQRRERRDRRLRAIELQLQRERTKLVELERIALPPIIVSASSSEPVLETSVLSEETPSAMDEERAREIIQRVGRRFVARRQAAAIGIQREARSGLARAEARRARAAARAIQQGVRGALSRQKLEQLRREARIRDFELKRLRRLLTSKREKSRRRRAATALQARCRGHHVRDAQWWARRRLAVVAAYVTACVAFWRLCRRARAAGRLAANVQRYHRGSVARRVAAVRRDYWRRRYRLADLDIDHSILLFLHPRQLDEAYAAEWRRLAVDGSTLACVDDQADFIELGVAVGVHRRRLIRAVCAVRREGVPKTQLEALRAAREAERRETRREEPLDVRVEGGLQRTAATTSSQKLLQQEADLLLVEPPEFEDDFEESLDAAREDVADLFR